MKKKKKSLIAIISFICLLWATPESLADYEEVIAHQKILRLKEKINHSKITLQLQKLNFTIVHQDDTTIIIRPNQAMKKDDYQKSIKQIESWKEIKKVEQDRLLYTKTKSEECKGEDPLKLLEQVGKEENQNINKITNKLSCSGNCKLRPTDCNGKNPAWAKMQLGADISEEIVEAEIKNSTNKNNLANLAVVDSGFDFTQKNSFKIVGTLTITKGMDSSGNPAIDENGHGTEVAGMIGAQDIGMNKFINLNLVRVTENGAGGSSSNGSIEASIKKACQTADVVNVSWGSLLDEIDVNYSFSDDVLDYAKNKGCLIIKASGNDGVKKLKNAIIPEDAPFLTVGSIGDWKDESDFSSEAPLLAPGEGVYSILSSQKLLSQNEQKNTCKIGDSKIAPIDGTSFAAPAVVGIAGQIVSILKARKTLPSDPIKKIKLIKRILLASASFPLSNGSGKKVLNAFAAAEIATLITSKNQETSESNLKKLYVEKIGERCNQETNDKCFDFEECSDKKNCLKNIQKWSMSCPGTTTSTAIQVSMLGKSLQSYQCFEENELSVSSMALYSNSIVREYAKGENGVEALIDGLWNNIVKKDSNGKNQLQSSTLAISILEKGINLNVSSAFISPEKLGLILNDFSFGFYNSNFKDVEQDHRYFGSKETFQRLEALVNKMSAENFSTLIKNLPKLEQYEHLTRSGQLNFLAYLSKSKNFPEELKKILNKRFDELASDWIDRKFDLGDKYTITIPTITKILFDHGIKNFSEDELKHLEGTKNARLLSFLFVAPSFFPGVSAKDIAINLLNSNEEKDQTIINLAIENLSLVLPTDEGMTAVKKYFINHPNSPILDKLIPTYGLYFEIEKSGPFKDPDFSIEYTQSAIKNLKNLDLSKENDQKTAKTLMDNIDKATKFNTNYSKTQNENLNMVWQQAFIDFTTQKDSENNKIFISKLAMKLVLNQSNVENTKLVSDYLIQHSGTVDLKIVLPEYGYGVSQEVNLQNPNSILKNNSFPINYFKSLLFNFFQLDQSTLKNEKEAKIILENMKKILSLKMQITPEEKQEIESLWKINQSLLKQEIVKTKNKKLDFYCPLLQLIHSFQQDKSNWENWGLSELNKSFRKEMQTIVNEKSFFFFDSYDFYLRFGLNDSPI